LKLMIKKVLKILCKSLVIIFSFNLRAVALVPHLIKESKDLLIQISKF